ncbi:MAG: hypothetical protein NC122_01075 [Faecalibacterium sp.]|nr:hypothetical protein [Ruminococcus sp.]MCM1391246.1 hypothetical protein [Ruminococcus sp.]MCM1484780.1 hypothetical protein [Faecalibacterium sp.]
MKNNDKLKMAFEEVEKHEILSGVQEEDVVREFSPEFESKMQTLIENSKAVDETAGKSRKKYTFVRIAVVAIIMAICLFAAGAAVDLAVLGGGKATTVDIGYDDAAIVDEGTPYEISEVRYTGKKVKINMLQQVGDKGADRELREEGLMIYVDGVKQTFDVKANGKTVKNTDMYIFKPEKYKDYKAEFSFKPNIGKKGDVLLVQIVRMYSPSYQLLEKAVPNEDGVYEEIEKMPYDIMTYGCCKLIMDKDASAQTDICTDYSLVSVNEQNEFVKEWCENGPAQFVYKDINDSFFVGEEDEGLHDCIIKTKADKNDKLIINMSGKTAKYRISLYINHELMSVFDGCSYMDVDVEKDKQTEITVNYDSAKLKKGEVNSCYVYYQIIDDDENVPVFEKHILSSFVYKIMVK